MFSKVVALFALVASAQCQVVYQSNFPVGSQSFGDTPHVGLQSEHTVRGFAGSSVSTQQKAIDSAFSSVRKTDTRVTNPQVYATAAVAPLAYAHHAAPAVYQQAYAAPAVKAIAAPAPVYSHAAAPVYSHPAPVYQQAYAAPAVKAIAAPAPIYSHAAPVAYGSPALAKVASPLLGVQYSAVGPAVASLNFNGYGISYGY